MILRELKLLTLLAAAALLAACGTTPEEGDGQTSAPVTDSTPSSGSGTVGSADPGGVVRGSPLDDPNSLLSQRVVYFAYDQYDVQTQDRPVIEAHGAYLAANPGATVTLEGHADERGSREYNIALGENRATAVRQLMALLGASGAQVRTVSYGEEQPAVSGHDENSWSQNRRVEIVYRSTQ
jgi:peptidoglycan-associated lipoprotein